MTDRYFQVRGNGATMTFVVVGDSESLPRLEQLCEAGSLAKETVLRVNEGQSNAVVLDSINASSIREIDEAEYDRVLRELFPDGDDDE